jgi:hypothetical protein
MLHARLTLTLLMTIAFARVVTGQEFETGFLNRSLRVDVSPGSITSNACTSLFAASVLN